MMMNKTSKGTEFVMRGEISLSRRLEARKATLAIWMFGNTCISHVGGSGPRKHNISWI